MALVRCRDCGKPSDRNYNYVQEVEPRGGFPNPAVICGRKNCPNKGYVWLDDGEWQEYREKGVRVFTVHAFESVKIAVE